MIYKYLVVQIHSSECVLFNVLNIFLEKSFLGSFYGWGSVASKQQSHYGEAQIID